MPQLWVTPEELGNVSESPFAYEACQTATYVLWSLSGRKFHGVHTVTEHYECTCRDVIGPSAQTMYPTMVGGIVSNVWRRDCDCIDEHDRVRLRGRPVQSVSEVVSMGRILSPADYRVVNRSVLETTSTGLLDPCDVTITYTFGSRPPIAGSRAARYLASQFVNLWQDGECDLPDRVTSVSRQGVSYTILDNQDFLNDMRTGVYEVDLFLKAANPDNARRPSRVFSPDLPRARRVTSGGISVATPDLGPFDVTITPGESATWEINLTTAQDDMLDSATWEPLVQVSSWNGLVTYEASAGRVSVANGVMTVSLTSADTVPMRISGPGQWDLYATTTTSPPTVMHLQSGNVYFTQ